MAKKAGIIERFFSRKIEDKANILAEKKTTDFISSVKNQLSSYYRDSISPLSGGAKWFGGLSGDGAGIHLNQWQVRQNARTAYHETTAAKSLVNRYADTVADIGLSLEAIPKAGQLGITAEAAEDWSRDIEERFDSWARSKKQHRQQTMNFYQSQRLYQIYQHRDNDIFVRLFYSKNKDLLNPLQFSIIDTNQVRGNESTSSYHQINTGNGITYNEDGTEKAYSIWNTKKETDNTGYTVDRFIETVIPRIGERSKRILMLHGFTPEYAGQGRGYSPLAHALQEFQNLTDFTSAQIMKAINQSQLTYFVKPSKENPSSNPLEGLMNIDGAGPAAKAFGSNPSEIPTGADNIPRDLSFREIPEAAHRKPGSSFIANLDAGEEIVPVQNTAPGESFDRFVDSFTSYLSASNGMPIEVLLMKFGQNYSASRATLILFWNLVEMWRENMNADYLNPVYEMWLSEEIAAGRVRAPGWSDPRLRAAWLNARWVGKPMPNIDPMRTAQADRIYNEMGAQTLDRIARNFNGSSGKANRAKLKREYEELPLAPWLNKSILAGENQEGDINPDKANEEE